MKKLLHLSDLHFGTERPGSVDVLINKIEEIQPDVIVVSGDLTQRARTSQYLKIESFFKKIDKYNIVCVPGNHDICLFNLIERFFYPYKKYQKYIEPVSCERYSDDTIAILGINSVTPYKVMGGFVTEQQLEIAKEFFKSISENIPKIVVMHHNLIKSKRHKIINDSEKIINIFASCNVNLVLSGHVHFPYIELLKRSYLSHNMYVITTGSAISSRDHMSNSFNVVEFKDKQFILSIYELGSDEFVVKNLQVFPL